MSEKIMTKANQDREQLDASAGLNGGTSALNTGAVSRRRLLKGGAAVTPVILTLTSKPVLAATCPTGSALASLNISGHTHQGVPCSGRTPVYWKQDGVSNWTLPYFPTLDPAVMAGKTTLFNQAFDPDLATDMTLLAAVQNSATSGEAAVRSHIVAALLNAAKGWNTAFLSVAQVQAIWNQYKTTGGGATGYWSPGNGVKLYSDTTYINDVLVANSTGLVGWLKENMPL